MPRPTQNRLLAFIVRHWRGLSVAGLVVIILITVLIVTLAPPGCPVELTLLNIDPSGIVDENTGKELLLVTLAFTNCDCVSVVLKDVKLSEVRVGGRWIEMNQALRMAYPWTLWPGRRTVDQFLVPAGIEACRVQFKHESEIWRIRLLAKLSPKLQKILLASPRVQRWFWGANRQIIPDPPQWKESTLEISVIRMQKVE